MTIDLGELVRDMYRVESMSRYRYFVRYVYTYIDPLEIGNLCG